MALPPVVKYTVFQKTGPVQNLMFTSDVYICKLRILMKQDTSLG